MKSSAEKTRLSAAQEGSSADGMADEAVLERSLTNPTFFEVLVERHQEDFLRRAHKIVRCREDAEDVVQDTFVKIYLNAKSFEDRPDGSFKQWAYTILTNTAISRYRKLGRKEIPVEEFFDSLLHEDALVAQREAQSQREREDLVEHALSSVSDDQERLLRMHYFEGFSYKDITVITGLTMSALKTRLYRAREACKKVLTGAEV